MQVADLSTHLLSRHIGSVFPVLGLAKLSSLQCKFFHASCRNLEGLGLQILSVIRYAYSYRQEVQSRRENEPEEGEGLA